eukprot:CAMPEP_0202459332 /NCGR_PEP_ID=MMETSP1360-20130828/34758_1 /ASSEMBLY_ACC=CAM_ASM_000848 /TAXON_ID=515479 /ORGANISM="Licmophora paradoxa, Strain CCMP2313" /LENGTH=40 /DNA_ID= /DNA_START= /DNA_END= /DNA_ORIENTATION=
MTLAQALKEPAKHIDRGDPIETTWSFEGLVASRMDVLSLK